MRYVRVQYDDYNRQFNLTDRDLAGELEDGGPYLISDSGPLNFFPLDQLEGLGVDSQTGELSGF